MTAHACVATNLPAYAAGHTPSQAQAQGGYGASSIKLVLAICARVTHAAEGDGPIQRHGRIHGEADGGTQAQQVSKSHLQSMACIQEPALAYGQACSSGRVREHSRYPVHPRAWE